MKKAAATTTATAAVAEKVTEGAPSMEQLIRGVFQTQSPTSLAANKKLEKAGFGNAHYNAIAETIKTYDSGAGIKRASLLGNTAPCGNTDYPTGMVLHFDADADVDSITLTPNSFQALVLCQISNVKGKIYTDADFAPKLEKLNDAVPQYAGVPISSAIRGSNNMDVDYWEAELGESGAAGILKRRRGARACDYFVYAKCGAEVLGADVIKMVADRKASGNPLKWGDFVHSKELIYWKNATMRNACRIAHRVAEHLQVPIEPRLESDTYTMTEDEAPRVSASPTYSQFQSSIVLTQLHGRPSIAQYIQCAPASESRGYHLVSVSPFTGLVGLKIPQSSMIVSSVLPTTTGRAVHPSKLKTAAIATPDVESIQQQYIWEGKTGAEINDRVHPEAYRAFDDTFIEENFVTQGWGKDNDRSSLDPVIMKIAARKVRQ